MSDLLITRICFLLFIHLFKCGCPVDKGIRASLTSMTKSTLLITSDNFFSAFAIWPGYHWILGMSTSINQIKFCIPFSFYKFQKYLLLNFSINLITKNFYNR